MVGDWVAARRVGVRGVVLDRFGDLPSAELTGLVRGIGSVMELLEWNVVTCDGTCGLVACLDTVKVDSTRAQIFRPPLLLGPC